MNIQKETEKFVRRMGLEVAVLWQQTALKASALDPAAHASSASPHAEAQVKLHNLSNQAEDIGAKGLALRALHGINSHYADRARDRLAPTI